MHESFQSIEYVEQSMLTLNRPLFQAEVRGDEGPILTVNTARLLRQRLNSKVPLVFIMWQLSPSM